MNLQQISDRAAIGLSTLCVVHCICLPLLLLILPPVSGLMALNDEVFHLWLLFAVVPLSVFALLMGYFHHRNRWVFAVGFVGLVILAIAALAGHDILGEYGEVALTVVGSTIIAYGHLRNFKLRNIKRCNDTHHIDTKVND